MRPQAVSPGATAPAPTGRAERASPSRLVGRALLLRCPHCGGRGLFASFFTLKRHCPSCGLRIERGESDYFVGAYLFNLIAVELILFFCVCGMVFVTWPDVPWDALTWIAGGLMLAGCFLCYPFAKTTWLAVDLAIRPLTDDELRWHHEGGDLGDRELPHV
jgi:uncharacterized protein (DUF983 family)